MTGTASLKIEILDHIEPLARRYEAILCDVWGVVHNGVTSIPTACDALRELRQIGKTVLLLSNAPRPWPSVQEQIDGWNVPRDSYDGIVTSGDSSRHLIANYAGEKIFHLGPERDQTLYDGLDVTLGDPDDAVVTICTGLYDDNTETPDDYADILGRLHARSLPMLCANPDILVERGDRLVYCAGAIAQAYEVLGGEVTYTGKPFGAIYDLARSEIAKTRGGAVTDDKILCVGDGIKTDMEGAFRTGLDAVFVASGLHIDGFDETEGLTNEVLSPLFAESSGRPIAAQTRLKW